jgi:uncharacterized protein (UPF0332 family)
VKTGIFDPQYHRWLLNAFDQRIEGDYGIDVVVVADDAQKLIERAKDFLKAAIVYLTQNESS